MSITNSHRHAAPNWRRSCALAFLGLCCAFHVLAQPAGPEAQPAAATVPGVEPAAPAPEAPQVRKLEPRQVPQLTVRWACERCEINPKVEPLIAQSYAEEAMRKGYTVSGNETVEIVLTDFRQRPPAARVMAGVFAGKDRLGGRLSFRGQMRGVSDYSANVLQGMNALSEAVGKQACDHVLAILQAP